LAVSDYWHLALLPDLLQSLAAEAPNIDLSVLDSDEGRVREDLMQGRVDTVIYLAGVSGSGLSHTDLVADGYACVASRRHPSLKRGRISLREYAAQRHVLVGPQGPWKDRLWQALHGRLPRIVLEHAHIAAALEMVAHTELVATLPRQIALAASRSWAIRAFAPPVDFGRLELQVYWHERTGGDPLHAWLRQRLLTIARRNYASSRWLRGAGTI
jgi:DNA-binding transcriptional LysR family regulator